MGDDMTIGKVNNGWFRQMHSLADEIAIGRGLASSSWDSAIKFDKILQGRAEDTDIAAKRKTSFAAQYKKEISNWELLGLIILLVPTAGLAIAAMKGALPSPQTINGIIFDPNDAKLSRPDRV